MNCIKIYGLLSLGFSVAIPLSAHGQTRPDTRDIPQWPDTARESGIYPIGDAVGVYRAVLDLLYVDGKERPGVILVYDTAARLSDGSCGIRCGRALPHKSIIDTATLGAFDRLSPKRPRLVRFDYRIPVVFVTETNFRQMEREGAVENAGLPSAPHNGSNFWSGLRRRYPSAWGYVGFSKVGFNRRHTEALVQAFQRCGEVCTSDEIVFLRRIGNHWRPVERIPLRNEASEMFGNLRYRGPAGDNAAHSQILAGNGRTESADAAKIYRVVLDSLYSFHGESPKTIVVSDRHARANGGLPPHTSRIDSSLIVAYDVFSQLRDGLYPRFRWRVPVVLLTVDSLRNLDREGAALKRQETERKEFTDDSPRWLAFHERYPRAWGYVELSRVSFNPEHSQALVYAIHNCGDQCSNSDTWLLERRGERWHIAERIPGENSANVTLDTLHYLGPDADAAWYRPRRVQGVVTNALTGKTIPFLDVITHIGNERATIRTDSAGRYALENLPRSGMMTFSVKCPDPVRGEILNGAWFMARPGFDSTVNFGLDYRGCLHLNRTDPLIGSPKTSTAALNSTYPSAEVAAVYRGVLDALYPPARPVLGPIMLDSYTRRACHYCIAPEIPRLLRQGEIDASTERNFYKLPNDTVPLRLGFPFRRPVEIFPAYEQVFLKEWGASEFWSAMKDAYPGTEALVSLSQVGFSDSHAEALVEVVVDSVGAEKRPVTMVLRKVGSDWRVTVGHVERQATSAEWSGGKCEPTDAPAHLPTRTETEKLAGEFNIVRVGASTEFRGRTDTVRVRLEPQKPSLNQPNKLLGNASVLDAAGKPDEKVAATFEFDGDAATIAFTTRLPKGMMQLDGWYEQYKILRTDGRGVFGTWLTVNGPSIPWRGYFCAQRR